MGGEKPEANGQLRLLLPQPPKSGFLRPPPSRENTGCRLSRTNSGARPASDPRVSLEDGFTSINVETSYLVALRIARAMKPDTIAKDLLLPVAKDIVRVMIGDEFVTKLSAISLSNDTIHRRIDDMSADILDQGFPACWLSSLNTEVDLLWKMIFVVLLQRLPREFLIW
ncbi:protein ZBED8-like isoform X1 [Sphaerodactylus townsendi]|uniref:protein ZBED8-like isoform X1 n=1 Tax=Sphaerodactylus townsendi TaxID=933632 RepID=UPI0020272047|nr:protein ZBED8-like isoform X1 [Sphaerodactylus townsendi]